MAKLNPFLSRRDKVPGLRMFVQPSDIKVFMMIDGKKTLIRTDPAPLQSIKGDITKW